MDIPAPIRDAASVIVVRDTPAGPAILMGQRGARAAFMPNKYVFPGGALDAEDAILPLAAPLADPCAARLGASAPGTAPGTAAGAATAASLAAAAIRELWEETGLMLGERRDWPGTVAEGWQGFAERGLMPSASALRYLFRAITPPGRPRRFDARFFLLRASALPGDLDDFSGAEDELSHLHWVPITEARALNLPFITEVVLAEVAGFLRSGAEYPKSVPFFDNSTATPTFRRIA